MFVLCFVCAHACQWESEVTIMLRSVCLQYMSMLEVSLVAGTYCRFPFSFTFFSRFILTFLEGSVTWPAYLPIHSPSMVLAFIMYPKKPAMGKHQEPFLLHELDLYATQVHHCIFMVQSKCCNLTELAQNYCAQWESCVELLWALVHWHACIGIPAQTQDPLRSPSNWLQSDSFFFMEDAAIGPWSRTL